MYEYTTAYLIKNDADNINHVTIWLNEYAKEGWRFTGYVKEVLNGSFYMMEREVK